MKRGSLYNSHMQTINWLAMIDKKRKKYVEEFNTLSKKEGSVKATAYLFQIKEGIDKLTITNQDSLKEKLSVIIEFLERELNNKESFKDLAKFLLARAKSFHKPDLFKTHLFATSEFKMSIKSYYDRNNGDSWHISDEYFGSIETLKSEINSYSINKYVLNSLLKEIINKNYPDSLENISTKKLEDEINNQGRPDDPSAPQEPIQNYIQDLIRKAQQKEKEYLKYWHFTGAHEGRPNKSQIVDELMKTKLIGDLSKETVKDRVNRALSYLGY